MRPMSRHLRRAVVSSLLVVAAGCGSGGTVTTGDGGRMVRTLSFPAGVSGGNPRFCPDGSLIAYQRQEGDGYGVALMAPTGGDSRTLATDGSYLTEMTWARDSSEVF